MEEVTALCLAWQSATLAKGEYEITLCIWGLWLACRWIPLFLVHSCITYTKGGVFNFFKIFSSCETLNIQVRNLL